MPFILLVVAAFLTAMVLDKGPNRKVYAVFALGAAVATVYFLQ